ncbi:nucleoside monophosphate kinase [Candidatus Woesearchaeota archaeon]|nr:nucleoside monophosphate kinase [Candidatus Woesearchaeota archaeon]
MGPQGSGKGTQAELIERDYGFVQVSMGDLLREEVARCSELGLKIKALIDNGNLVPEDITYDLFKKRMSQIGDVLLDGIPRNLKQAEWIDEHFKVDFVLVLELSEEETVRRLEKRRICTASKKIFISDKITKEDVEECKAAGGEIIQRDDDKPDAIKKRLQIYKEKTEPVISFFEGKAPIFRINGERSIDDVYADVKLKLDSIL